MRSRQTKLEKEYATRLSTKDAEAVSRMMNVMGSSDGIKNVPNNSGWIITMREDPVTKKRTYNLVVNVAIKNSSSFDIKMKLFKIALTTSMWKMYTVRSKHMDVSIQTNIHILKKDQKPAPNEILVEAVHSGYYSKEDPNTSLSRGSGGAAVSGMHVLINALLLYKKILKTFNYKTLAHELGHTAGLKHNKFAYPEPSPMLRIINQELKKRSASKKVSTGPKNNFMQGGENQHGTYTGFTGIVPFQMDRIYRLYQLGILTEKTNPYLRSTLIGFRPVDHEGY